MPGRDRKRITILLLGQAVLAVVVALMALLVSAFGLSALAGGAIALIPNMILARGVVSPYRADRPELLLGRIYSAQFQKLILTGLLFGVAFRWLHPLHEGVLFGAFAVVYLVPLMVAHKIDEFL